MDKEEQAGEIVNGMKSTFEDLKAKAAAWEGDQMSVYFEISPLEWGLWTAGTGTFYDEIANILNLKNAFGDVAGYAEISEEQVIERKPDAIVTISMYYGEGPTPVEEILSRPGWDVIPAVANEKILNLQNDELSRPAPRLAEGAQMLYDFVVESLAAQELAPAA
jgi:iron complex transport system substrate-binding protein